MYSLVSVLAVAFVSVAADPSPQNIVAPLAVAPAVVTAHSSQVISRNFNALASPIRAAPLVAKTAPLSVNAATVPFVGSPIVAAETRTAEAKATQANSSRNTEAIIQEPSRARSSLADKDAQSEKSATRTAPAAPLTTAPTGNGLAKASSVALGPAVSSVPVSPVVSARYNVLPAAYTALPAAYTALPAAPRYYFSSPVYSTSNYLTYTSRFL
ncbi:hypothetical protein JTB14_037208 [Gonioctena quinquepunctata]|nr:hypothetical protein JTB14_037208 [Gonioctena quinquepunctata]